MRLIGAIILLTIITYSPVISLAQNNSASHKVNIDIPEVALLGLVSENTTDISLHVSSPREAGNAVTLIDAQNNGVWLNYSSISARTNQKRKIVAFIEGELPQGMHLKVEASDAVGNGNGKLGRPRGAITLSNKPTDIITNIGSCYTGKGIHQGHFLTYSLDFDNSSENYAHLSDETASLNVIYTLTDNN